MRILRSFIVSISVLFVMLGIAGNVLAEDFLVKNYPAKSQLETMMPGELLVKFKPGVSRTGVASLNARYGAVELSTSRYAGFKRLKVPAHKSVDEMVAIYSRNPNVEYAEPNYIASVFATPDDPYYAPFQWHLDNPAFGGINMESAWDVTSGSQGIIVAVVDTGVAYEDYQEYVSLNKRRGTWVTYQRAPDLAATAFVPGYDFINDDAHPNDDEGHGTHVAGTIAQSTNNGIGVAGVAPNTSIMPVKVLDSNGSGTYSAIADGIYFAANNGARVISMSLGGGSPSTTLQNALAYAYGLGVTIVCASGNDGSATTISYPAAYDAYCIAVGATRYDEAVSGYSNRGASLDITAPGGDTSVDQNGDGYVDGVLQQTFGASPTDFGYYFYQGTSMATPHVSGVAALLLAQDPARTPADIREILQSTAEDKGAPGWDSVYGWGLLDAAAALRYSAAPNSSPVAVFDAPVVADEDVSVAFDASASSDDDGDPLTYHWDFGDGSTGAGGTTSHVYTSGGTNYTVSLVVNDGKVDSEPATATLWVNEINDPPVADAGPDQGALVGQVVTFDASGSYDIDDGIATYNWQLGDGGSAEGAVAGHAYAVSGEYVVTLTVTDQGGLSASDQSVVSVTDAPVQETLYSDIVLTLSERTVGRKNLFVKAVALVTITDGNVPVSGVTVSGSWSEPASGVLSAVTDAAGIAVFDSPELKSPAPSTRYSFTVGEVIKTGYSTTADGEVSDAISY